MKIAFYRYLVTLLAVAVVVPTHIGVHVSENHGMHAHPLALQE